MSSRHVGADSKHSPSAHGVLSHSSTSTVQISPLQPAVQIQPNASTATTRGMQVKDASSPWSSQLDSKQVPPFWHGELWHSSVSTVQSTPSNPLTHWHANASTLTTSRGMHV